MANLNAWVLKKRPMSVGSQENAKFTGFPLSCPQAGDQQCICGATGIRTRNQPYVPGRSHDPSCYGPANAFRLEILSSIWGRFASLEVELALPGWLGNHQVSAPLPGKAGGLFPSRRDSVQKRSSFAIFAGTFCARVLTAEVAR